MRNELRTVLFVCWLFSSMSAYAETSFICATEMATGFAFNEKEKKWENASFAARGKYVVSKSKKLEEWEVRDQESKFVSAICPRGFKRDGSLFCAGTTEFRMNQYNRRFIRAQLAGYWTFNPGADKNLKEGQFTPAIEIGTCTPVAGS